MKLKGCQNAEMLKCGESQGAVRSTSRTNTRIFAGCVYATDPAARVPEYEATGVRGYRSTRVPEYEATGVRGYRSTRLPEYEGTGVRGYRSTRNRVGCVSMKT
ncbi:Octopamine receptor oamb [Scophthalmus maximus]|uniref:Octopamine receptor oamb n=1 Tax=Scophthalmus maximus TaxID=52904 RepID=A0A2U9CJ64_SCOMX|nr:Octopamine receptor oamb [Scophthalmus maximus]